MHQRDIDNKNIAVFHDHPNFDNYDSQKQSMTLGGAEYHLSWDSLMPVCKKCRDENFKLSGDTDQCGKIMRGMLLDDIKMAYEGVVEFLSWYNPQIY